MKTIKNAMSSRMFWFCMLALLGLATVGNASAQYTLTNAVDPSLVIKTANDAWTGVSGLKISILAFAIIFAIVGMIRRSR